MLVTWPTCNILNQTEAQRQSLESESCSVARAFDQGLGRKPESQEVDPPKLNNNNKNKQTHKQTKTQTNKDKTKQQQQQ